MKFFVPIKEQNKKIILYPSVFIDFDCDLNEFFNYLGVEKYSKDLNDDTRKQRFITIIS
jgi:hypothetical protein